MNTTTLLAAMRRLWLGPINSLIATDELDLLAHADAIIAEEVMPFIVDLKEEYCVVKERIAFVPTQNLYEIPDRAFDTKVRHVSWEVNTDSVPIDLDLISFAKRDRYRSNSYPTHWWFENDQIGVNGEPSGNLIIAYPFKPNSLVNGDGYRIVQSVNTGTNEVTLTQAPPSTWLIGDRFDIIDSERSGMPRYWDKLSTNIAGSVITFDSEIAGGEFGKRAIQAGDYIAPVGEAGRPMVPESLHGVIAQGMCARAAQGTTDVEAFQLAQGKFMQDRKVALQFLDARAIQKNAVINYNSRFRRGRVFRRRFL